MNLKRKLIVGLSSTAATIIVTEAMRPFRRIVGFFVMLMTMLWIICGLLVITIGLLLFR